MRARPVRFPDDWIKPGEFNFCNRCGLNVSLAVPNLCRPCQGITADADIDRAWVASTVTFRNAIATIRRNAGLPPLFWMLYTLE